jgi:putative GTP pyrophosphokinase
MDEQTRKFVARFGSAIPAIGRVTLAPYETKKAQFLEFYAMQFSHLRAAEKTLRNLIQLLLVDLDMDEPKIDSRVKDRDECLRKFELKYRNEVERTGKDYEVRHFITDLIGIRVICLYETDIAIVKDRLHDNFDILTVTDKTATLTEDVSSFGYKGLHLDLRLRQDRSHFPEYKKFADFQFEVQIRSIVQDAWSEIDHKLKYKRQIPDTLKRRIIRLAALFELADQEFVAVKDETERLQEVAAKISAPDEEAKKQEEKLDAFSFLSLIQPDYPGYTFDPIKVDGFVDEISSMQRGITVRELQEHLTAGRPTINRYRDAMLDLGFNFNPFTAMRHMLYFRSPTIFDNMLFPRQRDRFLDWLGRSDGAICSVP